ncbi:MAG: aminotransferase class V-fold PLP-dependent enzyme, partial [Pseudomonadota bacterium]
DALESHLKAGAKFIAAGYASNVLGTVNDVSTICAMANQYGAITYIDAVHYAPHGLIDVGAVGCAMLVCSAYKFYGPHCAAVYIEPELLDRLNGWPLRPAPQHGAAKFESGTMNHECIAGTHAALDYLKGLGAEGSTPRAQLANAFEHITAHEQALVWQLIGGLQSIGDFKIHGITDPSSEYQRTPTVSITHDTFSPQAILNALTRANIFCWAGHSYAIEPLGQLGLLESGGVLRLGIAHYNTQQEINQVLNVLSEICNEID